MRAVLIPLLSGLVAGVIATDPAPGFRKLRQSRKLQVEVDEYDCSSKTDVFSTTVMMDFHTDVSMLDDTVINQMEEAFIQSYSELIFSLCDVPYFRTISEVEIGVLANTDTSMEREFTNALFQPSSPTHILKVDIQANCRGCEEDIIFSMMGDPYYNSRNLDMADGAAMVVAETRQSNVCVCPAAAEDGSTFEPEMRTPTETEFRTVFTPVVVGLNVEGLPETFDLFEAEPVECESTTNNFTSTVYVRFDGDLSTLDDADIVVLEEAFIATYNGLNFAYCDIPYFRTITNATLDRSSLRARTKRTVDENSVALDFSTNVLLIDPPFDANNLKFEIAGECRGCEEGTPLFSFDDASGSASTGGKDDVQVGDNRTIQEIIDTLPPNQVILDRSNYLQGDSGTCYCPAHPEPVQRAPTAREFQAAYNVTLTNLKAAGAIEEVAALKDVLEITEVACNAEGKDFTAAVFVALEMNKPLSQLSDFERFSIEDSYLQSYNALTFSTCDQFFRRAVDVTLVSTISRRRGRLLQESNATNAPTTEADDDLIANVTEDRFPALFSVLGDCRGPGCDGGDFGLYDDVFRRRSLSQGTTSSSVIFDSSVAPAFQGPMRWLQADDSRLEVCFCPAGVPPDGSTGPTSDEFIDIFNFRLRNLEEAGIISGFGTVVDLVEVSDICDGGTFYSFMDGYELGFSGDIDPIPDSVLGECFRVAYNSQRPEDCDPLVVSASVIERNGVPVVTKQATTSELEFVRLMVDSLALEMGDLFAEDGVLERFIEAYNTCLAAQGFDSVMVTGMFNPTDMPSVSPTFLTDKPTRRPTRRPTRKPTRRPTRRPTPEPSRAPSRAPSSSPSHSPSAEPSKPPSIAPSFPPSIPPSNEPSAWPTNNRAMCNDKITNITDHVIIDYSLSMLGDIHVDLPFGMKIPEVWPLEEPATLIAAAEYIAAYNKLQQMVFCDPFKRKMTEVTCISTYNNIISGTLCCTVHFKCKGNCEEFIYPDRDPIGAFYDQPGFEYPTDGSCNCKVENSVDRAPSASEHFNKINGDVPLEILSFEFKGFATDQCPDESVSTKGHH